MQLHYTRDICMFCGLSLHGRWIFRHRGSFALSSCSPEFVSLGSLWWQQNAREDQHLLFFLFFWSHQDPVTGHTPCGAEVLHPGVLATRLGTAFWILAMGSPKTEAEMKSGTPIVYQGCICLRIGDPRLGPLSTSLCMEVTSQAGIWSCPLRITFLLSFATAFLARGDGFHPAGPVFLSS